jgi:hypothetical protein
MELINIRTPEDGDSMSPKRRFELELHGTKPQKTFIIDTDVEASQRTVYYISLCLIGHLQVHELVLRLRPQTFTLILSCSYARLHHN